MAQKTVSRSAGLVALMAVAALVAMPRVVDAQGGRGGGGGFGPPTTQTRYDDYAGFTRIFDGTFTNWNGERDVWSIVDGLLHADTTKTPGQHHIHYTGPGAVMRDFTLKVEVKLSAAGANVSGSPADVPVLIRLHLGNFGYFADAKPDGSDLRFVAGDDKTPLKFHLERYDAQSNLAFLWVKVPRLAGGTATEKIYLYYGNSSAPAGADGVVR